MLELALLEQAMRQRILAVAASHTPEVTTYEEVWDSVSDGGFRDSGAFRFIGRMLYHIATYEQRLGRPMLTSLVVKSSGKPGDGFFDLAEEYGHDVTNRDEMWTAEKDRVRDFWSRALDPAAVVRDRHGPMLSWDPTLLGDRATLVVFEEIKRRV